MRRRITREQYKQIQEAYEIDEQEFEELLREYTGITTRIYIGHSFFDENEEWCGDDHDFNLDDVLNKACIEVIDNG